LIFSHHFVVAYIDFSWRVAQLLCIKWFSSYSDQDACAYERTRDDWVFAQWSDIARRCPVQ
jgi:hypothetical protein